MATRKIETTGELHREEVGPVADAYALLRITSEEVDRMPRIERMLEESKNLSKVWRYIERSPDAECRQIIGVRCSLRPDHASAMSLEAYLVAAGIKTPKAFAMIGAALAGSIASMVDGDNGEPEAPVLLQSIEDFTKTMSDSFSENMDIPVAETGDGESDGE